MMCHSKQYTCVEFKLHCKSQQGGWLIQTGLRKNEESVFIIPAQLSEPEVQPINIVLLIASLTLDTGVLKVA